MTGRHPFIGEGEVRALARSLDWASTPLGPIDGWSRTLRDVVRTCLDSPFPINLWCEPGLVLIYNDAYSAILGDKHPEALGRTGRQVWAEIWDRIEPMFERIRRGGRPVYEEDSPFLVHRTGVNASEAASGAPNAWFTYSLSGVRDPAGEIVAYLNVVSESTASVLAQHAQASARAEAERAERRLRDVFAQAPAFMAVLRGPGHVFEYVNEAYYQLVGRRDLLGRPVSEALPEVRGQGFEGLLDSVVDSGEPYIGREVPVVVSRTPDRPPEERFVDLVYYPISDADGTRTGVVAHGSDVTDHVLARREAQRARAEAERANRAKSQFLATMSHEIRTPINAVMGYGDLLDAGVSGELTPRQKTFVDGIRASSKHLLGLINDMLDLAKIEAGELDIRVEEVPARPSVRSAVRIIEPQAEGKGLTLDEAWECDEEVRVRGDEGRIRQILLNLLSNALKFTDPGGRVTVRCRVSDEAAPDAALPEVGPWVVVEVEDTGRGMDDSERARMFDPFVQADAGPTRRAGGTGLGLTISRRLARLLGGELTVTSEPGEGSRFSLWLAHPDQEWKGGGGEGDLSPLTWPPAADELPGLASVGRTLLSTIDAVEDEWVERLRADARVGVADRLNRAQLADQTAELIAAIAKSLFVLEEGAGDRALLADAEAIQGVVARRHGQQRSRLGWNREAVQREYQILGDVLDRTLRREAPKRTAADLGTSLGVVRRLVGRARTASLNAYDDARRAGRAGSD